MLNRLKIRKEGKGYEEMEGDVRSGLGVAATDASSSSTALPATAGTTVLQEGNI